MEPINIAIIDDQHLIRQGIASLIDSVPEFCLTIQAIHGQDFLDQLQNHNPASSLIALVDIEMPVMDGIALTQVLQKHFQHIKIIILSNHAKERLIAQMIHNGASGYLLKNCDKSELVTAINMVNLSGFYINEQALKAIQNASSSKEVLKNINNLPIHLSEREKEILQYICKEYSNAEIAQQLYLSQRTIEGHRNNLIAKTGCRNTAGLVLFAVKHHVYELNH